jgi:hypothetical protein
VCVFSQIALTRHVNFCFITNVWRCSCAVCGFRWECACFEKGGFYRVLRVVLQQLCEFLWMENISFCKWRYEWTMPQQHGTELNADGTRRQPSTCLDPRENENPRTILCCQFQLSCCARIVVSQLLFETYLLTLRHVTFQSFLYINIAWFLGFWHYDVNLLWFSYIGRIIIEFNETTRYFEFNYSVSHKVWRYLLRYSG